ncbi:MAG: L,D-transpeptidase family protein [Blastomonas sp.]
MVQKGLNFMTSWLGWVSRTPLMMAILTVPALLLFGLLAWVPLSAMAPLPMAASETATAMTAPADPGAMPANAKSELAPALQPAIASDQAKAEATAASYRIKSILNLDGPLKFGSYAWDESNAPASGQMLITVDLTAQTLSVFRDGHEIGAAAILFGDDDKPTPLGVFPITEKDADHISNLYGAPMPYMLRLTNDGISIHGSDVEWGLATHGCIGVPVEFAELLFRNVKLGDIVIITDGEMMKTGDSVKGI